MVAPTWMAYAGTYLLRKPLAVVSMVTILCNRVVGRLLTGSDNETDFEVVNILFGF